MHVLYVWCVHDIFVCSAIYFLFAQHSRTTVYCVIIIITKLLNYYSFLFIIYYYLAVSLYHSISNDEQAFKIQAKHNLNAMDRCIII